jgi:Flp pilus assembly pilin Flp
MLRKFQVELRRFHEDEEGIESLQVVMIIAIAALVLIAVFTVGKEVVDWMKQKWNELRGKSVE